MFFKKDKIFNVINICCCLILPFVFARFLNIGLSINLMHHFLLHWIICFGGYLFFHTPVFFEKYLTFCVFPSVPHLVDNYAKTVDERGRNLMCDRTLPSLFVYFSSMMAIPISFQEKQSKYVGCFFEDFDSCIVS